MCIPYFKSKNSFKVFDVEKGGPKVSPNFQIGSNVRQANKLLIESFSQGKIKPTASSIFKELYG